MKTRSFEQLRDYVLPKIHEIFAKNGRTLPDQPFQKHFWSYYHKAPENVDLKREWKKLPRTKPQISLKDNDSSFIADMLDKSESNDDDDNNNSLIFEEDGVGVEKNWSFEEEVKDVGMEIQKVRKCCNFEEEFNDSNFEDMIPVENFFKKDSLFEDDGFLTKEVVFEAPNVNFDNDIMTLFDKSFCN